jgi:enamine deaminase RidA (YjgF/YER057c/UK114 family)
MTTIERLQTSPILSQAVVHDGIVYLSGQVAFENAKQPFARQTEEVLGRIDALLKASGSSRAKILSATIWIVDTKDFEELNRQWTAWMPSGAAPARASAVTALVSPDYAVEIMVTAAL